MHRVLYPLFGLVIVVFMLSCEANLKNNKASISAKDTINKILVTNGTEVDKQVIEPSNVAKKLRQLFHFGILMIFSSCFEGNVNTPDKGNSLTEIKRIRSSDQKVEAVLIEKHGGATVATGSFVYIVRPGQKVSIDDSPILNADYCTALDLKWKDDQQLIITYDKARIFDFTNFWHSDSIDNWNYVVEVALKNTSTDGQLVNRYTHVNQ